jgi:hypothetical protein
MFFPNISYNRTLQKGVQTSQVFGSTWDKNIEFDNGEVVAILQYKHDLSQSNHVKNLQERLSEINNLTDY